MGYICTRCGGTNVVCEAIVNPNTGKIIDYLDESFMHAICSNCENEVIISNIEGVKHEIDLRFHEFVEKTGKEPEYVECQIVWKKTGDEVLVRASNLGNWNLHLFARVREEEYKYECLGGLRYKECIPYQGNEHLLGTNKSK